MAGKFIFKPQPVHRTTRKGRLMVKANMECFATTPPKLLSVTVFAETNTAPGSFAHLRNVGRNKLPFNDPTPK